MGKYQAETHELVALVEAEGKGSTPGKALTEAKKFMHFAIIDRGEQVFQKRAKAQEPLGYQGLSGELVSVSHQITEVDGDYLATILGTVRYSRDES